MKANQTLEIILAPESAMSALVGLPRSDASEQDAGLLLFATDRQTLERQLAVAVDAAKADRLTWIAYPKARQLGTDLNRDLLASLLEKTGVEPVRQISIDDVWSALRFRPAE
jgi:hypothetical protein